MKTKYAIRDKKFDEAASAFEDIRNDSRGRYLKARIFIELGELEGALAIAHSLAQGKVKKPQMVKTKTGSEQTEEAKGFFVAVNSESARRRGKEMAGMIMFDMDPYQEKLYYAYELYRTLGETGSARICLEELMGVTCEFPGEDKQWVFAAIGKEEGPDAIIAFNNELEKRPITPAESVGINYGWAKGDVFLKWIKTTKWAEDPEVLFEAFGKILASPALELVPDIELTPLVDEYLRIKQEKKTQMDLKIAAALESAEKAETLEQLNTAWRELRRLRHEVCFEVKGVYDQIGKKAENLGTNDSIYLAMAAYQDAENLRAKLMCAFELIRRGQTEGKQYEQLKNEVLRIISNQTDKEIATKDEIREFAREIEAIDPVLSLEFYCMSDAKKEFIKLARDTLDSDDFELVKGTARQIIFARRFDSYSRESLLLKRAFDKLNAMGEQGVKWVQSYSVEMHVSGTFRLTSLDVN